jgi:hypothetical protein
MVLPPQGLFHVLQRPFLKGEVGGSGGCDLCRRPVDMGSKHRKGLIQAKKWAILHRKSSPYYRPLNGAYVGDICMSLIHSAELNKVSPFGYLVVLQHYHALVAEDLEEWMPWNYAETLAGVGV